MDVIIIVIMIIILGKRAIGNPKPEASELTYKQSKQVLFKQTTSHHKLFFLSLSLSLYL